MSMKTAEVYLTIPEIAAIYKVKHKTIRAWIAQEHLGCVRFGRAVRVPMSEVLRLIEEGSKPARQKWTRDSSGRDLESKSQKRSALNCEPSHGVTLPPEPAVIP